MGFHTNWSECVGDIIYFVATAASPPGNIHIHGNPKHTTASEYSANLIYCTILTITVTLPPNRTTGRAPNFYYSLSETLSGISIALASLRSNMYVLSVLFFLDDLKLQSIGQPHSINSNTGTMLIHRHTHIHAEVLEYIPFPKDWSSG